MESARSEKCLIKLLQPVDFMFPREITCGKLTGNLRMPFWLVCFQHQAVYLPKNRKKSSVNSMTEFSPFSKDNLQFLFRVDLEETFDEYKDWIQEEPDKYTKQAYNKALIKLEKVKPYEEKLSAAEPPRFEEYQEYIKYEEKEGDPARIQCLYERAIQENCLNSSLWLQYTKYLDHTLRVPSVSINVFERSVRNCPWCVQLWQNYILTLERSGETFEKVKGMFEAALTSGFSQGSEVLALWTTFIDYLRRRIKWNEDHEEELETFRLSLEKAIEQIDYYGTEGDPNSTLRQFWALIEAKFCKNLEKARELWAEIMATGRANEAALWMEYFRFERTYGDNKHCRRVLQRALNSVTDWPESIVDAYVNFERMEGNLEQCEQAVSKCEAQMERINERREKEQQAELGGHEQRQKFDKKGQHKFKGKQKPGKFQQKQQSHHNKQQQKQQSYPKKQQQQQQQQHQEQITDIKPYKRKNQDLKQEAMDTSEDGFKVPAPVPAKVAKTSPPPGFKEEKSAPPPGFKEEKVAPPPGYTGEKSAPPPGFKQEKSAPPPGFKEEKSSPPPGFKRPNEEEDASSAKRLKTDTESSGISPIDDSKDSRMVFLSNLSYEIDEDQIKKFFDKCGAIEEIRLIKNYQGKSRGYAYVEFADQLAVSNALTYDRTPIEGRPMFVSKYKAKGESTKQDFKYGTSLEKNKLFIKNLPFTCTEEALRTLFSQHGEVKHVRLVTYRSGAPKGLAYVEFADEHSAAQAVVKTDGIKIGEHEISVAISNPPARKTPVSQREESSFIPSLGGGKKETQSRHARTQVMLMPRAVTKRPQTQSKQTSSAATQNKNESSSETLSDSKSSTKTSGMSNSDFRNMLLKK
ncbi:squamous cell carcinoma antigen recognized by T-cells 3-like isoform X2 [Mercenaria mercenaria]|uniref:squamous cell carcinoma antigen recognized by T-cells 3-like isoform X2 n=1 Tax=Mercenaria mercenaria TaxID=6596 RepID=UPI00234F892C|nr:squamous cell carcinoma antigen recognized by T-cells 3-like isoform X2 [Mercenaria mercenaria]